MEKLELMSEAIDFEDWMEFDDQAFKLKGLNPSDDHLNKFGREQIMKAVVENKPVLYLETLQRKLNSIGVTDDALNLAYDDGAKNRNRVSKASVIKSVPVNKWLPMVMSVGKRWIFKYMLKSPKINHLYPSPV